MSNNLLWLALWLDAPLQSWGFESVFERRHTAMFPTKSGVLGLVLAAMGVPKGSDREHETLEAFTEPGMVCVLIPRRHGRHKNQPLPVRRLTDYHTVLDFQRADTSKARKDDTVQSWRDYLMDARFGVLLPGKRDKVEETARRLIDPIWGIWLGRKSCPPATPLLVRAPELEFAPGLFGTREAAWRALLLHVNRLDEVEAAEVPTLEAFPRLEDADFSSGTDTWNDTPLTFGTAKSSGVEGREFAPRRVCLKPGS
ncbi:type I-E CRISPR-associated protein Cas5/CasD [bacterium]|nr:MAG: type I-E CRISPR-associated protein Cas5/CasD [bacterium]